MSVFYRDDLYIGDLYISICRYILILVLCAISVVSERKTCRIGNSFTTVFSLSGLVLNTAAEGAHGIFFSLAGWGAAMACLYLPYRIKAMGAGDVKMISAIGAITGYGFAFRLIGSSFAVGAVFAIIILFRNKRLYEIAAGFRECCARLDNFLLLARSPGSGAISSNSGFSGGMKRFSFSYAVTVSSVLNILMELYCFTKGNCKGIMP